MVKMVVGIALLAVGLYLSYSVKLGELTFREHIARILDTDEAHELGDGIINTVTSAKETVKSKVNERLEHTKEPVEEEEQEESDEQIVRFGNPFKTLPQH